ncbi:MAG: HaeIII family restriction endonuclease [Eubacteriaceae bacterium]|nr:HaeIII family restriction endonuclease [Eubacteriaceae bacterium]
MMANKGIQTTNGKAFEYACLLSLKNSISTAQEIAIEDSSQKLSAQQFFENSSNDLKDNLMSAADAAVRAIVQLEPQLMHPGLNSPLVLALQTDAQGLAGDVRDVICYRKQNNWQIGISCKHNHRAVKHSRLSATIDFGAEWFGIPCSKQYFSDIAPLFEELESLRSSSNGEALWSSIENKNDRFYIPLLQAFIDELRRLDEENIKTVPKALISYLVGRYDFYKVITDDSRHTTRIEGINLFGTLNRPSNGLRSRVHVSRLKLPNRFYYIGFKNDSSTTVEVVCNEGWAVSLRIHNASSRIEPSLKFDVNLISLPSSIHAQVEPW